MKKGCYGVLIAFVVGICVWMGISFADDLQPAIASKILRFHVIASSDSSADQLVKLEVRDAVGAYLSPLLKESNSIEETKRIVSEHMEQILAVSEEVLERHGFDYEVSASIATTDFPEKTYGVYTFPAGEYEALQIQLGEAKGQNWWCVLYPNMCFYGSVYEVVEEEADESLREVLSPLEYAKVFDFGQVLLRFKFLELFCDSGV